MKFLKIPVLWGTKLGPKVLLLLVRLVLSTPTLVGKPSHDAASTKGLSCMDGWTGTSLRSCMQVQLV